MDTVVVCHTQRALTATTSFRGARPPLSVPLPLPSSARQIIVAIFHRGLTHVGGPLAAGRTSAEPRGSPRKLDKFEIKPLSLKASTPPTSCYDAQATFYLISPSSRFIDAHIFPNFLPEGCKGAVQPSTSSFAVLTLFSRVNGKECHSSFCPCHCIVLLQNKTRYMLFSPLFAA